MKTTFTFLIILMLSFSSIYSQDLVAKWTFPTGSASDVNPDGGAASNTGKVFTTAGGTSSIDFTKNGSTTKSAQITGWDNGTDTKYCQISLTTTGYKDILVSSKMQSGGNNPGPRDFKLQYKIGDAGTWTDVANGSIVTANDWSTGALSNLPLPTECNDTALIYIRWIMTSNSDNVGGTVASTGILKVDDIYVYGTSLTGIEENYFENNIAISYNKTENTINFKSSINIETVELYNINGSLLITKNVNENSQKINISNLSKGIYIVRLNSAKGIATRKVLVN
ncbi:MAG: hypothetical protein A2033_18460 [Bacteroidetes bacterium GWA2_31_9]|nr:MAG: hypothetical protein A2033_18460 [Bacteroidetes bacterium GWA2_31_9]